jgi:hypothetical protein
MSRRYSTLLLGSTLLFLAGCRSTCWDRHSWFSSNGRSEAPCRLTSSGQLQEGCYDPVTGQPVPCPPATSVIPGGVTPRPDELPFPGPADMIPPTGVPSAPPGPAPAPYGGIGAGSKGEPAGKTAKH